MKKFYILFIPIVFLVYSNELFSQNIDYPIEDLKELSQKEKELIQSLPELKLPKSYVAKSTPVEVDNSLKQYYIGLFAQHGLTCGQVSSVANVFGYEINRLRGLNGTVLSNKYPTYFAWNWENNLNNGVSYYHTLQLLKTVGTPTMDVYGGADDTGDRSRWMYGYNKWYQAMHNRIRGAYNIKVNTPEGIQTLKHWMNDHLDGSPDGGIAMFYSGVHRPDNIIPANSVHSGEGVCITMSSGTAHSMTLMGYNDSVKYDLNGDGLYTKDVDINGDGVVNVKDWEIGAFIYCNGYAGAFKGWVMYSSIANVWNGTATIEYAIADYSPSLTAKVKLTYNHRNKLKVIVGASQNLSATEPDMIMSFPVLNFQGLPGTSTNYLAMQGDPNEIVVEGSNVQELEFGLDITPLLNSIPNNTSVKYFLQVIENDGDGTGVGVINNFSIIDYTTYISTEIASTETFVPINNNTVTTMSVTHAVNANKPTVTTSNVALELNTEFSEQLQGSNGATPYVWELDEDYTITSDNTPILVQGSTAPTTITLPFTFPFFGENYTQILVQDNGAIGFQGETYSAPYNNGALTNASVLFSNRKYIAAFLTPSASLSATMYKTIEYGTNYVEVRWLQGSLNDTIDVTVKLEDNGCISFYYANCDAHHNQVWSSGISLGDNNHVYPTPVSGSTSAISNVGYKFTPVSTQDLFTLTQNGILSVNNFNQPLSNFPVNVKLTDACGLIDRKTIIVNASGLVVEKSLVTPNNSVIENNENCSFNVVLTNVSQFGITNINLTLRCDNPNITITDSLHTYSSISIGQQVNLSSAFSFTTNSNLNDGDQIEFTIVIESDQHNSSYSFVENAFLNNIFIESHLVNDGNNEVLDSDETSDFIVYFKNSSELGLENVSVVLSSQSSDIIINNDSVMLDLIVDSLASPAVFNISAAHIIQQDYSVPLSFALTTTDGYEQVINYNLLLINLNISTETWEDNSFETHNWNTGNQNNWMIINGTPSYDGSYCLMSDTSIVHNEKSTITIDVLSPGGNTVSFFSKVSSEANYDFLKFYINNVIQESWSGNVDWAYHEYSIPSGYVTLKWEYTKDYSVSNGSDCAWIDNITFPFIQSEVNVEPNVVNKSMSIESSENEILTITNLSPIALSFSTIAYHVSTALPVSPSSNISKNISNSYVTFTPGSFLSGDTCEWYILIHNSTPDDDYIRFVQMTFPPEIYIDSVDNIYSNSDSLTCITTSFGYGPTITWIKVGGDNPEGVITYEASVRIYGHIDNASDDLEINYLLTSDYAGEEPHYLESSSVLNFLGTPVDWLSVTYPSNIIGPYSTANLSLYFNTYNLTEGTYTCSVFIDNLLEPVEVPVTLYVNSIGIDDNDDDDIIVYPNPSADFISIKTDIVIDKIEVINILGEILYYNDKNSNMIDVSNLNPGTYYLRILSDKNVILKKIIVLD